MFLWDIHIWITQSGVKTTCFPLYCWPFILFKSAYLTSILITVLPSFYTLVIFLISVSLFKPFSTRKLKNLVFVSNISKFNLYNLNYGCYYFTKVVWDCLVSTFYFTYVIIGYFWWFIFIGYCFGYYFLGYCLEANLGYYFFSGTGAALNLGISSFFYVTF